MIGWCLSVPTLHEPHDEDLLISNVLRGVGTVVGYAATSMRRILCLRFTLAPRGRPNQPQTVRSDSPRTARRRFAHFQRPPAVVESSRCPVLRTAKTAGCLAHQSVPVRALRVEPLVSPMASSSGRLHSFLGPFELREPSLQIVQFDRLGRVVEHTVRCPHAARDSGNGITRHLRRFQKQLRSVSYRSQDCA